MATRSSRQCADNFPVKTRPQSGLVIQPFTYTLTSALPDAEVIELCKVPVNAQIVSFFLSVPDLDTNGTPAIQINVGLGRATSGEADVDLNGFIATSNVGQSAGILSHLNVNGVLAFPYLATGDAAPYDGVHSKFCIEVETAPATGASSGTIRGWLGYVMDADWESSTDPS